MTVMFRSDLIKRLPTKLLAGLAVLAAVLVVGGGLARPAHADGTAKTINIEFQSVRFDRIDDGPICGVGPSSGWWPFCGTDFEAEVYGAFAASASSGGYGARNLAAQGSQPSWCKSSTAWTAGESSGPCFKHVSEYGGDYQLSNTTTCWAAVAHGACTGPYTSNGNWIRLSVKPGDTVTVGLTIMDYDWGSGNDVLCKVRATFNPFTSQQSLKLHSPWNGDGECHVSITFSMW